MGIMEMFGGGNKEKPKTQAEVFIERYATMNPEQKQKVQTAIGYQGDDMMMGEYFRNVGTDKFAAEMEKVKKAFEAA